MGLLKKKKKKKKKSICFRETFSTTEETVFEFYPTSIWQQTQHDFSLGKHTISSYRCPYLPLVIYMKLSDFLDGEDSNVTKKNLDFFLTKHYA